jgi:hypothetical protein
MVLDASSEARVKLKLGSPMGDQRWRSIVPRPTDERPPLRHLAATRAPTSTSLIGGPVRWPA